MKTSIAINAPIDQVIGLYMDKNNFKEWKKGMLSYEPVSGIPGTNGAVTKLLFKNGGTLYETIVANNLPAVITADYEHAKTKMIHTSTHRFTALAADKTLVEAEMNITKYAGLLSRIIIRLLSGAAQKYAQDQLRLFKTFAEQTKE
jgi:hypothetical protein